MEHHNFVIAAPDRVGGKLQPGSIAIGDDWVGVLPPQFRGMMGSRRCEVADGW
jgi:hypothetical protein